MAEIQAEDVVRILSASPFPQEGEKFLNALASARYVPSNRRMPEEIVCLADFPLVRVDGKDMEASAYARLPHWVAIAANDIREGGRGKGMCLVREESGVTFSSVMISSPSLIAPRDSVLWGTVLQWGPMLKGVASAFPSDTAQFWYNPEPPRNAKQWANAIVPIGIYNLGRKDPYPFPLLVSALKVLSPPADNWEKEGESEENDSILWRGRETGTLIQCLTYHQCLGMILYTQASVTVVVVQDGKSGKAIFSLPPSSDYQAISQRAWGIVALVHQIMEYVPKSADSLYIYCGPAVNRRLSSR